MIVDILFIDDKDIEKLPSQLKVKTVLTRIDFSWRNIDVMLPDKEHTILSIFV